MHIDHPIGHFHDFIALVETQMNRPRILTQGCVVILFVSLIVAVGYAIVIAAILAKWQPGHQEQIYRAYKAQQHKAEEYLPAMRLRL
jgi:hypothetical protein